MIAYDARGGVATSAGSGSGAGYPGAATTAGRAPAGVGVHSIAASSASAIESPASSSTVGGSGSGGPAASLLREAGAIEVHVRIASPPVKWPCYYGIDFASRAELIANGSDADGIRRSIGADSLGYISLDELIAASEQPEPR